MKLLTLNCHSWQEKEQIEKIKYLAKTVVEEDYDVIALQEASQSIEAEVKYDNIKEDNYGLLLIEEIEKLGGAKYHLAWDFSHIGYDIYEEGSCIITKHKIVDSKSFYISQNESKTFWKSRKIIKATVEIEEENIDFYSCHMGWWKDEEESFVVQVKNLLSQATESKNRAFFMGDFNNNAFLKNEGYDFLKSNGLIDTFNLAKVKDSGVTVKENIAGWDDNTEELRIDIIFTNKETDVEESKVIFNGENKKIISDHFGVYILLK
ncbi:endonuclease/exonuclease/phosphatase family protein [Clostridium sp. B9]|uniref:endonuclease/exonuclease/phosphatase family protein n=1 Tax=Clostridium sp. B9 TaxID=3423224 RepID=UPI003D2F2B65